MIQVFQFSCGNKIKLTHDEEVAIPKEGSVLETLGMFFHYVQQQGGAICLNDQRVYALSMAQTCGGHAYPCDYVGLDCPVTKVATIESLLK